MNGRAGKPTAYKGITFRSRLEARWAAMFDLLGWAWEYEPECDGAYIPDFLLHGHGEDGGKVYVEVKPEAIYQAERSKIIRKARAALGPFCDILVVVDGLYQDPAIGDACIGYMPPADSVDERVYRANDPYTQVDMEGSDEQACLIKVIGLPGSPYDFRHEWGFWKGRLSGFYGGNAGFMDVPMKDALAMWSRAGNAIQWKPSP